MIYLRRIVGDSMYPTYSHGRIALFVKSRTYCTNDVVLLVHGGLEKMKRIRSVNNNEIYVVGDNSTHSTDSRNFGLIPMMNIKARLWLCF